MSHASNSTCIFCGSTNYGQGCNYSPNGYHIKPNDPETCRFCGSPTRGKGCHFNPSTGLHVRGAGGTVCVYCGSPDKGQGCHLNPTGIHDRFGDSNQSSVTPSSNLKPSTPPKKTEEKTTQATLGVESIEIDSGTMLSIGDKCRHLFSHRIPGWWHIVGFLIIATPLVVYSGYVAYLALIELHKPFSELSKSTQFIIASPPITILVSYWLRNVTAKILARYYIGIPALVISYIINRNGIEINGVVIGPWLIAASIIAWLWPIWPILAVFIFVLGAVGKGISNKNTMR
jgi:hypothetical protein